MRCSREPLEVVCETEGAKLAICGEDALELTMQYMFSTKGYIYSGRCSKFKLHFEYG